LLLADLDLLLQQFDLPKIIDYTYYRFKRRTNVLFDHEPELFWDSTYAIVMSLMEHHPTRHPDDIGIAELEMLVEALPGFQDDPALVTEQLLLDILTVWYEEAT